MNQVSKSVAVKKKSCPHCGNNPTSHVQAWIDSSVCVVMSPVSQKLLDTYFGQALFTLTEYIIKGALMVFLTTRIARFDADHSLIVSERGKVLSDEIQARGNWKMETLLVFGKVTDAYRITFPSGFKMFFSGLPRLGKNADIGAGWIDDKALLKQRLMERGVAVSRGKGVSSWAEAEQCFHALQKPLIVKPRLGSRGRHTTTHIHDVNDLKRAFTIARQLGKFVIVEEHLTGSVYRATVIDGVLAGVLAGEPPRVTGDGGHTIEELITLKNETRPKRVSAVEITEYTRVFLKRQNYTLESILPNGETIDLSEKIGLSYGGKSIEITPHVHPKLRTELEKAAAAVQDALLGFDFITTDVSVDPDTVRWGIIECNTVPFINLHHDPLEGEPVNVAAKLLDYLERKMAQ